MGNWTDLRMIVIAAAFLAIGFIAAEQMTSVSAAASVAAQDCPPGNIDGASGTTLVTVDRVTWVVTVRDKKIWRVPFDRTGDRIQIPPWVILAE